MKLSSSINIFLQISHHPFTTYFVLSFFWNWLVVDRYICRRPSVLLLESSDQKTKRTFAHGRTSQRQRISRKTDEKTGQIERKTSGRTTEQEENPDENAEVKEDEESERHNRRENVFRVKNLSSFSDFILCDVVLWWSREHFERLCVISKTRVRHHPRLIFLILHHKWKIQINHNSNVQFIFKI